ncbi:MAG: hypothetical protein RLZZ292_465 [Bacteroidota bacterium]|jgi:hypothetical protein
MQVLTTSTQRFRNIIRFINMKRLFFFILLLFSLSLSAQNTLTFGEVYDFNLGDVLQTTSEYQADNATEYVTQTIIGKQNTDNQQSVQKAIRL